MAGVGVVTTHKFYTSRSHKSLTTPEQSWEHQDSNIQNTDLLRNQSLFPHAKSPVGYIAKYASKSVYSDLPHGARLHDHLGFTKGMFARRSWTIAPVWFRTMRGVGIGL